MGGIAAVVVEEGVVASVLVAALTLGLRHGFDWDHVAAISDITATTDSRRGLRFGTVRLEHGRLHVRPVGGGGGDDP